MFSKSCEYAIRAIVYLALNNSDKKKVGVKHISDNLEIPVHFLGKILQTLVRHKIISSSKGRNGGFFLTKSEMNIPIIKVVEIIDGDQAFTKCCLGLKECSDNSPCPLHSDFKPFRKKMHDSMQSKSVSELAREIRE